MNYLLSIIVPTRNREEFAYLSAIQILESTSNNVQLVIQDNSDTDSLKERLFDTSYSHRIKYNYSPKILSFVDNFSKGVEIADGEYLCIIGDDDGINPEIEVLVRYAKYANIKAVSPDIRLNYIWPNTGIDYYSEDSGNFMIVDFSLKSRFYSTNNEIEKLLDTGGQNYLRYNLAKIYHGIVTKELMEKVKSTTGKYFGGLSPDIYSAITLSLVVDKVLRVDYPLTIPGVCRKSGSGQASTGRHLGKLEDAPQLVGHTNYQWSSLVPSFYSVETLWADTALSAFNDMQRGDLIRKFNVPVLSAYCAKYKEFRQFTKINSSTYFKEKKVNWITQQIILSIGFIKGPFNDLLYRILARVKRRRNSVKIFNNVSNIIEANNLLKKYLNSKGLSIDLVLNILKK